MPIIGLQQQQTEVGRIRLGVLVKPPGKKARPEKLDKLRFTSPRRALVERIAELYGGTVEPWQPPRGSQQWQVITAVTEVPVLIPPQDPSQAQWYEMWSAGGCQRRCDGQTETISRKPCLCTAENLEPRDRCKMHTRLRVMLEDVPGLGAWRVDTGSFYAAVELPGVAALLAMAQGAIPGKLVLDQRTVTRDGKTRNFVVPTLHVEEITPRQLASGRVQELITANRAAAIDGNLKAIGSGTADYAAMVDAATNLGALHDVHDRAKAADALTPDLVDALTRKAAEIREREASAEQSPPEVEGEIVDSDPPAGDTPPVDEPVGEEWPPTAQPPADSA